MRLTNHGDAPVAKPTVPTATVGANRPLAEAPPRFFEHAWIDDRMRVAVGRNINISGKLAFSGPARIDGQFRGEISSPDLVVISETGAVDARVRTPRIMILGEFHGEVIGATAVIVGPSAHLKGRVETATLTVHEGARIEADLIVGRARRGNPAEVES